MLAAAAALAATAFAAGLTSTWSPCGFSMVETIGRAPGRRATRAAACATFALGALVGGTTTFAGLAWLGHAAHGAGGRVALVLGLGIALAAAVGEARGLPVVPQVRRQVPEPWRRVLPLALATGLYGVLLGLGFTTFVLTLGVWALAAMSFALGNVALGLAVGLAFGAGRALPVVAIAPLVRRPAGARALELMAERPAVLRGFRLAGAALLVCSVVALGSATARAAVPVAVGGSDPTVFGGLLAWDSPSGGLIGNEPGAPTDPHRLGSGGRLQLPGRDPTLGGSLLAYRAGEAVVHVARADDFAPVTELALPGATAFAVSDGWLVYRAPREGGGERLVARALVEPGQERELAAVRPPAELGRPALTGTAVVFHVADPRSSRIVEVDLVTGNRRVLRSSRLEQLSNPAALDGALVYVRQSNLRQLLQLGPRRPGGRDRTLYRTAGTARRDDGFDPGHSHVTLTPRAGRPATSLFWTTALGPRFAYLSLVPVRGRGARARIVSVARGAVLAADPWARLRRPLHLPVVAPGAPCPVSRVARFDFARCGIRPGIGPGPAYPVGFAQPGSVLHFTYPPDPRSGFAGSEWSGQKVVWFVAPSYRGPVLVRGGRLDAPDTLRFEPGLVPPTELRIAVRPAPAHPSGTRPVGHRFRPSLTRLRAPGCYAYQIDGTTFSRTIVFRAELWP